MEPRPINDISFRHFLEEKRLMGSRCSHCSARFLPPRPICPHCRGFEMEWVEFESTGKLVAFTCIAVVPPAMAAEGYGRNNPYCSGVVQLGDNIRVDARIEGVDAKQPNQIRVGMLMKAKYVSRASNGKEMVYLAFEPA
jgi:scaffold protein (connect acetoacetyl-CoA thiolase and HMG-CoA synthase)